MKRIQIYFILALIALCSILSFQLDKQQNNISIYKANQETLLDTIKHYKIRDSLNVASINALILTKKELEKFRAEDAVLIKDLKAKKTIAQYVTVESETNQKISTRAHDSIVYVHDTLYIAHIFTYESQWTDVSGIIFNDTVKLQINNRESLLISQSKIKKKFWFIKLPPALFGYKAEKIDVLSKNPNTVITDIEFVKIK